jgi:ADP-ribosylation factor-like protein 8
MSFFNSFLSWLRSLFFTRELEITLVGLQNSGTSLVTPLLLVVMPATRQDVPGQRPCGASWFLTCPHRAQAGAQAGHFSSEMIPTIGFNMRKVTCASADRSRRWSLTVFTERAE